MEYEIVNLEEKTIVGIASKTSNTDPEMGVIIAGLWSKLYNEGVYQTIKNKADNSSIGLYSDYDNDGYEVTVGIEVTENDNKELVQKIIPAGKYAKFSFTGNVTETVADVWGTIWNMDLDRSFTGDFEQYLDSDMENNSINIFIALK